LGRAFLLIITKFMKRENIEFMRKTATDGSSEDTKIYGLEDGEEQYYTILGTGYGINIAHCFSMGSKNKEKFWERVFAYKVIPNGDHVNLLERVTGEDYISVEFYELS